MNFRIQDGRQSAILNPNFTKIVLAWDCIIIHNISKFEDDRPKIDSRALTMNLRIQDGRHSAILNSIFTNIDLEWDFMVTHNISKFEDDRTEIGDSRVLNNEFQNSRWPPVRHFESEFNENRTRKRFYHQTQYIQIWRWSDKNWRF